MPTFFTVDLGATSGRTVLARLEGGRMTLTEFSRFENPILPISGHWFWNLPHLYNEILKALGRVAQEGIEIESIGIDTWGCDFSLFGSDGQLLGLPYSYRDPHTDGAQPLFFGKMPSRELYDRTGIQFMNFNSVFQLDTLRRNGCRALDIADKILFTPDALTYMLTGEAVCEYTIASTSQLVDVRKRDLDPEILSILGLWRGQFGRLVQPGTIVGTISPQVQKATGLGPVPVIAVAGHDTASAVAAVPARDRNFAYLSCGTWSLLGIEASAPVVSEESFTLNFTNEGGIDGKIRFLKNICGLWIFEQSRKEFKGVPTDVVSLVKSAETSSCRALIDPDAPVISQPDSKTQANRQNTRLLPLHFPQPCDPLRRDDFLPEDLQRPSDRRSPRNRWRLPQCLPDAADFQCRPHPCHLRPRRGYRHGQCPSPGPCRRRPRHGHPRGQCGFHGGPEIYSGGGLENILLSRQDILRRADYIC